MDDEEDLLQELKAESLRKKDFEELKFQSEWLLSSWESGAEQANLVEFLELLVQYDHALPQVVREALSDAFDRHSLGDIGEKGYGESKRVPLDSALRAMPIPRKSPLDEVRKALGPLLESYKKSGTMPPIHPASSKRKDGLFEVAARDLVDMGFRRVTPNTVDNLWREMGSKPTRPSKPDLSDFSDF